MTNVNTRALLPKGEPNGLAAVADHLLKDPLRLRAALMVFDLKRGTTEYDQDDTLVTVRIRRVELLLPQDLNAAEVMIRRALEDRSGQTTLELELEDEIRKAFEEMRDPESTDDPDEPGKGEAK